MTHGKKWCCYCGREGHLSKDCPLAKQDSREGRPN